MLGEPGKGTEVLAAEVSDLGGFPISELVMDGHRLEDPSVHREGLELARTEEQHTVGDIFADAGQFHQPGLGRRIGQVFGFIEPAGAGL